MTRRDHAEALRRAYEAYSATARISLQGVEDRLQLMRARHAEATRAV